MKKIYTLSILLWFSFYIVQANDTQTFLGKKMDHNQRTPISLFTDYEIYEIDAQAIASFLQNDPSLKLNLQLGEEYAWNMSLAPFHFRSPDCLSTAIDNQGNRQSFNPPTNRSFRGYLDNNALIAITFSKDFIYGMIKQGQDIWYIEPIGRLTGNLLQNNNQFVVYHASDIIPNENLLCAFDDTKKHKEIVAQEMTRILNTTTETSTCRKVEIAQAYDAGMSTRYGSNANLSTWNAAIWNVVQNLYTNEFTVDIEFEMVAEAFNAGITTDTDITTFLSNFQTWGNAGNFGVNFDIGNLWTTVDVCGSSCGVIGSVMAIPGVCGNARYQIFEDFVGPTSIPPTGAALANLAILIAHEAGHNLGMFHNDPGGANIMEPFLNASATGFTDISKHYFESMLLTTNCISSCECIEVYQATPINCSADGSTYDLELVIEHETTSGNFTVSAGGESATFAYGANPQTVTLSNVPVGTTSITATDDNTGSCTFTATLQNPPTPSFNSIATSYCVTDNTNYALTSNEQETYGTVEIIINGDNYSNDEQSAQILDANSNVVGNYPRGTFANASTVNVSMSNLLLSNGPYQVIVADWYGDGMDALVCHGGTEIDGSYTVRDGQGNIIANNVALEATDCGGNDALIETVNISPAIDNTVKGNFAGTGVNNGTINDGSATFNPATAGVGQHNVDYTFSTYFGCSAERFVMNVYAVPVITSGGTTCVTSTTYDAVFNVDLGAWNSIASGESANISISASAGTVGSNITASGTVTVTAIPENTNVTLTVGDGTENGGCTQMFTISGPNCLLPVELISFKGFHQNNSNLLVWETATETENSGFEILRRKDNATDFEKIAWVEGNGTTSEANSYRFVDKDLDVSVATYYYQLRQIDFDGNHALSQIIAIFTPKDQATFAAYPNPIKDQLNLSILSGINQDFTLEITDALGRIIHTESLTAAKGATNFSLATNTWSDGIYFIRLFNEQFNESKKMVVHNK